jgi:hypothetical protein
MPDSWGSGFMSGMPNSWGSGFTSGMPSGMGGPAAAAPLSEDVGMDAKAMGLAFLESITRAL